MLSPLGDTMEDSKAKTDRSSFSVFRTPCQEEAVKDLQNTDMKLSPKEKATPLFLCCSPVVLQATIVLQEA